MTEPGIEPAFAVVEPALPLCVRLEGTLLETDPLQEAALALIRSRPFAIFSMLFWAFRGKRYLQNRIAAESPLDVALLPIREDFLLYLRDEYAQGRALIAVTETPQGLAGRIAGRFGIFGETVASGLRRDRGGATRSQALSDRFGRGGFDYAANAFAHLPVWREASEAILVNASPWLANILGRRRVSVSQIFHRRRGAWSSFVRGIRVHQWAKNILVFAPLLLSHNVGHAGKVWSGAVAFLAFSLCASGVYLLNDLLDLESDRRHATKRFRPLASGRLPIPVALCAAPALTAAAFALGFFVVGSSFALALTGYWLATLAYSFRLKRVLLVDVITLAALYTLRIIAGGVATRITVSPWTLLFSAALFLSLALMKRYSELLSLNVADEFAHGRAYRASDAAILASAGLASGYASVVVMALYINSPEVTLLYSRPVWLWPICLLQSYFISRFWLLAHRGVIQDDPVVAALKDRVTYALAAVSLLFIAFAIGSGS